MQTVLPDPDLSTTDLPTTGLHANVVRLPSAGSAPSQLVADAMRLLDEGRAGYLPGYDLTALSQISLAAARAAMPYPDARQAELFGRAETCARDAWNPFGLGVVSMAWTALAWAEEVTGETAAVSPGFHAAEAVLNGAELDPARAWVSLACTGLVLAQYDSGRQSSERESELVRRAEAFLARADATLIAEYAWGALACAGRIVAERQIGEKADERQRRSLTLADRCLEKAAAEAPPWAWPALVHVAAAFSSESRGLERGTLGRAVLAVPADYAVEQQEQTEPRDTSEDPLAILAHRLGSTLWDAIDSETTGEWAISCPKLLDEPAPERTEPVPVPRPLTLVRRDPIGFARKGNQPSPSGPS